MADPAPEPAEEARLVELLQTLRDDEPASSHSLALVVVRRARWQARLLSGLKAVSHFAAAAGDLARTVLGRKRESA